MPISIVAGPDGNLWFTEAEGDRIGRITPAGVVTEFSAGITPGSGPYGDRGGPDGNLWFTEAFEDQVGRITPSGVVTEFPTGPALGNGPRGIAAGPDGNVWFTEYGDGRVGRITPAGFVTRFSAGITPGAGPEGIAAGPDGNLWFTESFVDQIGRITPAGVVTEFGSPSAPDGDGDGIADVSDNCPAPANTDQRDGDDDGVGDACEPQPPPPPPPLADRDLDGVPDAGDNCATVGNPLQGDADDDGIGDACEVLPSGDRPPVAGVSSTVRLVAGEVFVKLPAGASTGAASAFAGFSQAAPQAGFVPLKGVASIPVGAIVYARKGTLAMQSAANGRAALASATIRAAIFQIRQARARRRAKKTIPTDLVLKTPAGAARACAPNSRVKPVKGVVRSISVAVKGVYRAVGAASTAASKGTATFSTQDRCNGTLTKVTRGKVVVRDAKRKRTVTVRGGHTYLAKARLFAARRARKP